MAKLQFFFSICTTKMPCPIYTSMFMKLLLFEGKRIQYIYSAIKIVKYCPIRKQ